VTPDLSPEGAPVVVRPARRADVPAMVELVRALADYERAADQVEVDDGQLAEVLFGDTPMVFAHVAEHGAAVVGMAIWFVNFSTWTGRHGIYLEDLFVHPAARRRGAGRALLTTLAQVAAARGYSRVEWAVLDWNEPAIDFYRRLGALPLDDWTIFRLSGSRLRDLAAGGT
jgi:GNAT superfamily N-acetyltransferase